MKKICAWVLCAALLGLGGCGQVKPEETEAVTSAALSSTSTEAPTTETERPTVSLPDENPARMPLYVVEGAEPITYTVTRRIHPDMGKFTFMLHGVFIPGEGYADKARIDAIDIQGTGFHQRLEGFITEYFAENHEYGFLLCDFNNDGYLDIQLREWLFMGNAINMEPSLFWLWDNQQKIFIESKQLKEMSHNGTVTVENDRLFWNSAGRSAYTFSYYEYKNGNFVLVEEVRGWCEHEDGSIADRLDTVTVYIVEETRKLINGKMELVSTTKEKIDRGEGMP